MTNDIKIVTKQKIVCSGDGGVGSTCYYRKFAVVEDIVMGEIVPCNYDNMRWSEVK